MKALEEQITISASRPEPIEETGEAGATRFPSKLTRDLPSEARR